MDTMLNVTRSHMTTMTAQVRVPVRWSTEEQCFVPETSHLKLGPNDRLEWLPHDLQMQHAGEGRFQLTIGAMLTQQS